MAISFSCDCGQEFKVSDSHAGKRIKCQGCGNPVKIPQLKTKKSNSDSGAVAVGKAAKKKRAVDEEEDPLVHSASEYDSASEFDIGNVPLGKLIEDEEGAAGKNGKKKSKKSDGEAAEKPKKKKRKEEDSANPIVIGLFLVLGLCSLSALGYFGFKQMGGTADKTPLEKKFVTLEGPEKVWSFERPDDWKVQQLSGGTGGKPPVVLIEGDGAVFRIKGSMGGSAIGSIAQATGGIAVPGADDAPVGGGADLSPETAVHQFQLEYFKADYDQFEEEPMQKLKMPYGEGRLSVFTGKESFLKPKIKGYRVTFSDNNWQYNLRAYAPESQWERFQPTFKKMIDSISR
jgi:hypothetical protein